MPSTDQARTPGHFSRRRLLQAGGLAAGAVLLGRTAPAAAAAAPSGFSEAVIWDWHEMLADAGPRLTGNAAHTAHVDFLADQIQRLGALVQRDRLTFDRWEPQRWGLQVAGQQVPVAFYYPYSGITPAGGVTAPLAYVGSSFGQVAGEEVVALPTWELARGKIAVVDAPTLPVPFDLAFREQGRSPADAESPPVLVSIPSVQDILTPPDLAAAKAAGVLGVVCIRAGVSDALAEGQYSPFITPYQDCPAVWLNATQGQKVRALALTGATATLTMQATLIRGAASETLYAVLPGADRSERVIVNTHTDGPNVPEENGPLGMLSLLKEFRDRPLRRDLLFLFTTGHFQLPQFARDGAPLNQASSRWMDDHPDLVNGAGARSKAVAAVTIEHLGCREWADDPTHTSYGPTGENEVGWCYTTTPTVRDIYLQSAAGTTNTRTFAAEPNPPLYFGEGGPFYAAGIATMGLIPGMSYLTAVSPDGQLSKLDSSLITGQIETFSKALRVLDATSASAIGVPSRLPSVPGTPGMPRTPASAAPSRPTTSPSRGPQTTVPASGGAGPQGGVADPGLAATGGSEVAATVGAAAVLGGAVLARVLASRELSENC